MKPWKLHGVIALLVVAVWVLFFAWHNTNQELKETRHALVEACTSAEELLPAAFHSLLMFRGAQPSAKERLYGACLASH